MVTIKKERSNAQDEYIPSHGLIFRVGTVLKIVDYLEIENDRGKVDDQVVLEDHYNLRYTMPLRSFKILRGDEVIRTYEQDVMLASTIEIVEHVNRTNRDGIIMYPETSYNGYDHFCMSRQSLSDYNDLLDSGIRENNTAEPKQYYTVKSTFE